MFLLIDTQEAMSVGVVAMFNRITALIPTANAGTIGVRVGMRIHLQANAVTAAGFEPVSSGYADAVA